MIEIKNITVKISIFALFISLASLFISAASMYYSNIRKTEYISVAAEWMEYPVKNNNKLSLHKDEAGKFLVINGGNTPISIRLFGFFYSISKDKNVSCDGIHKIFVSTDASATVVKSQEMSQIDAVINSVRDVDNVVDNGNNISFTPRFEVNIGDYITKCAVFNYSTLTSHNNVSMMQVETGQIDSSGVPSYSLIKPSEPFVIRDSVINDWSL